MKYYLIAGEASGDLHASRLMEELRQQDSEAQFRFLGGDNMAAVEGATMAHHYRDVAYMGFVPVLTHLHTIMKRMREAKSDIKEWKPDAVILVDYPGFNLDIAKYVRSHLGMPVVYYISPKIWAWKEWRIKRIKRDVTLMLSILPFEKDFFEGKHHYPIQYVGNPTADEVAAFRRTAAATESHEAFAARHGLDKDKRVIALLAGSRRQEIKDNLPAMLRAAAAVGQDYELALACAPGIDDEYYASVLSRIEGHERLRLIHNATFPLLAHSHAALVTSGTATLETALFGVPQVVCYETPLPRLIGWLRRRVLSVEYISLVNLIAAREVVKELVAETFTEANIRQELSVLLRDDSPQREAMMQGYRQVASRLGTEQAPVGAATAIINILRGERDHKSHK